MAIPRIPQLPLRFDDFPAELRLDEPYSAPPASLPSAPCLSCAALEQLLELKNGQHTPVACNRDGVDDDACWRRYRSYVNQMSPAECRAVSNSAAAQATIAAALRSQHPDVVDAATLPTLETTYKHLPFAHKLKLWKGDITTLKVDAIVNAANAALLGCFSPLHLCIDNAIHTFAGPMLRDDCSRIMQLQGFDEPTGIAKVTRAYNLPSRFVLHTVGPVVDGGRPTEAHEALLAACYTACLDMADRVGAASVALCCVSTGVFGYPAPQAAACAVVAVLEWLAEHQTSTVTSVIFDVFSDRDVAVYNATLHNIDAQHLHVPRPPPVPLDPSVPSPTQQAQLERVARWFKKATHIVIGAAAGFSVDSGIDFASTALFSTMCHSLLPLGLTRMYHTIGFHEYLSTEHEWGVWACIVQTLRLQQSFADQFATHKRLLALLERHNKRFFVKTTNVDGMFERSGFPASKVFSVQGDMQFIQCATPCSDDIYDFRPHVREILAHLDPQTQWAQQGVPLCPRCGGPMMPNLRGSDLFVEAPWMAQQEPFLAFVEEGLRSGRVLFLEFGVGTNTPVHLRMPFEAWTAENTDARLVRINLEECLLRFSGREEQYEGFLARSRQWVEWLDHVVG